MPTPAEIASRGIRSVRVGDRSHEFFTPKELRESTLLAAADLLDDTYGGFIPVQLDALEDQDE